MSPDFEFPRFALQLDHSRVIGVIASLDGHVHHGLILAATATWAKPNVREERGDRARNGHGTPEGGSESVRNIGLSCQSG
jgi:hypothetical protein